MGDRRLPFGRGGLEADCYSFPNAREAGQGWGAMSPAVRTVMAAGSMHEKQWGEAGDLCFLWEGSSFEQPHMASVLQVRGVPGLEPEAGSPPLFWGSCVFMQDS